MADDRPAALSVGLLGFRFVLAVGGLVIGAFGLVLAWSVHTTASPGDGRFAVGTALGVGGFLLLLSTLQLLAILTVVRGGRWWAFVELHVVDGEPSSARRATGPRASEPRCHLELTRTADEQVVGRTELPCDWAARLAEDGVVAVYGGDSVGDRIALGGRVGVCWLPGRIRPAPTRGARGTGSTTP